jgi:hypothetical protein
VPNAVRVPRRQRLELLAAALGAAAAAAAFAAPGSQAARIRVSGVRSPAPVTVSPLAGTPDASPSTQISFLGGPGTTVSDVRVRGSRSGSHAGRLEAYSTATGESFLPARPFVPAELVRVIARVTQGTASTTAVTSFRVALQPPVNQAQFPLDPGDPASVQHYLSAPSLTPSTVSVTTAPAAAATPGDFFLAPYQGAGTAGPMIADQSGALVWFHPLAPGLAATDFRTQTYEGRSVLTWWQGRILKLGFGQGEDEIYSSSYQPLTRVLAGNGYRADLHEFLLTPDGTAWIDAVDPVAEDLEGAGGAARGVVSDSVVQEIDVRTGLVMWEWHALGHIPLRDSYAPPPHNATPWYYAHVNSIDPSRAGKLLVSARNTWTIYEIDLHSGKVVWRIGGKHPSFRVGHGAAFHYQHDAAWQPGGLVSVFDNGGAEEKQSRGLLLDPSTAAGRVTLVRQFIDPDATLLSDSQGDLLRLPGGNWLMGYGGLPNFAEFGAGGELLLNATLGPGVQDYRTYLSPWSAQPAGVPAVAAQAPAGGGVTVEASWNGATAVRSWEVLAGPSADSMSVVATVARAGFETSISLPGAQAQVAVAALGAGGETLGTSAAISPSA